MPFIFVTVQLRFDCLVQIDNDRYHVDVDDHARQLFAFLPSD